jgi:hypothetical protein
VQPVIVSPQAVPTQALPSQAPPPVVAQPQIAPPQPTPPRTAAVRTAKPKRQARVQTAPPPVARSRRHLGPSGAVIDPSPRTTQSFSYGATLPSAAADGHVLELRAPASAPPTDVTGSIGANARPVPRADIPNAAR